MINTVITDTPIMRSEPLEKTFLVYLFIFFLLGSVWLLLDLMTIAAPRDTSKDFSQIFVLVKTFFLGLVASGIVATLFAKQIINPLIRNINAKYEIHTPCSLLATANLPYLLLNACLIMNLLLSMLTNKLCPFINLDEIGESFFFLSNDCTTLFKHTPFFMLGAGAGLSLGSLIWAQKKEQLFNAKILVNFHWPKTASTEYLVFAAIILLYLIFGIFFSRNTPHDLTNFLLGFCHINWLGTRIRIGYESFMCWILSSFVSQCSMRLGSKFCRTHPL